MAFCREVLLLILAVWLRLFGLGHTRLCLNQRVVFSSRRRQRKATRSLIVT